jgi:hypothetical protein
VRDRSRRLLLLNRVGAGLALTVLAVTSACSTGSLSSPPGAGPSRPAGYEISNVAVEQVRDPVPDVYWVLVYDAEWTGSGTPVAVRCRWAMANDSGVTLARGAVFIRTLHGRNLTAGEVHPDEIPGQPVSGEITCPVST